MSNSPASKASELIFLKIDAAFEIEKLLGRIKEILVEGNSHNANSFTKNNWLWQYKNLPTKDSRIYICLQDDVIYGYYHVPVYEGIIAGVKKKFAMVQDVAVSDVMRGKGVFRKLAEFATNDLINSDIDLIYTFPNKKSIHTFLKYNGYQNVFTYDSYLLPVKTSKLIKSKINLSGLEKIVGFFVDSFFDFFSVSMRESVRFNFHKNFNDDLIQLFATFNSSFKIHLNRSKEYLQWRFADKPGGMHFIFSISENEKVLAVAVFKTDLMLGAQAAVLLDFAYTDQKYLMMLIHHVRKNSKELFNENIAIIFTACCCHSFLNKKKYGFIKIPERFNPRPLNMLARNVSSNEKEILNSNNWLATLADWDVL